EPAYLLLGSKGAKILVVLTPGPAICQTERSEPDSRALLRTVPLRAEESLIRLAVLVNAGSVSHLTVSTLSSLTLRVHQSTSRLTTQPDISLLALRRSLRGVLTTTSEEPCNSLRPLNQSLHVLVLELIESVLGIIGMYDDPRSVEVTTALERDNNLALRSVLHVRVLLSVAGLVVGRSVVSWFPSKA